MKKIFTSLLMLAAASISLTAFADPVEWTHPKVDVDSNDKVPYVVGEEGIIYHSMDYPDDAPSYYCGWVTFKPAEAGQPVNIEFTEFTVTSANPPTGPFVYIYDNLAVLTDNFKSYTSKIPDGWIAAVTAENASQMVTSNTGELCVLYAPQNFRDGTVTGSYTATVTSAPPTDMVFQSATFTSGSGTLVRGMTDVTVATLQVKNKGTLNPLILNTLSFDLTELTASNLVKNVRLYDTTIGAETLLATLAEGETTLQIADRPMKGNNTYLLVADVVADSYGSIPAPALSTLTIGGEAREVDATGLSPLTVENAIYMPVGNEHLTYTIDEDTKFYDAGGPDANIPLSIEGTVTFVPATEGSIIKFDPSVFQLFNTSSTGNNDVFRAYSGREVAEEALIADLLDKGRILYSAATDGSMTIYFKSVQGNTSAAKAGWDATVSQVVPTDMVVSSVTKLDYEPQKPAAGDNDVRLMLVDIHASNTLNPLEVKSLKFTLPAEANVVEGVSVSFLGDDAASTTSTPFGNATVGTDGTVTVTGSRTLAEGANVFAVAVSIVDNAANANAVSLKLAEVGMGETSVTVQEVEAATAVENTCRLTEGEHAHTLYGDWQFTHNPSTLGLEGYECVVADHTVTFTPSDPGAKTQIEFADFDVYYSSSSYYGTQAKFEIYSGSGDSRELLWSLNDASLSQTGPGKKLRSRAADGSLTVVFNPNTTSSYYGGKGWHATVKPFIDHNATVSGVEVTQPETSVLGPGSQDAELIRFTVSTEGTLSPLTLNSVKLNLKGASEVKAVKVYQTVDGNINGATLWGSAEIPAATPEATASDVQGDEPTAPAVTTVDVTPAADQATLKPLTEEPAQFLVAVDTKEAVTSDVAVDAALTQLGFTNNSKYEVEDGDPEGERLTKNIYILTDSEKQTVNVSSPIMFYDQGGPDGNIEVGKATVTFVPTDAESVLSINATEFSIGRGKMMIYSGREVDAAMILGKPTGYSTTNGPENLVSKAADGSLTIDCDMKVTTLKGFAITVTPVKAVAHHVASVAMSNASENAMTRGGADHPIAKTVLTVEGNKSTLSITGVTADLSGSTSVTDVTNLGVYYSGKLNRFAPNKLVGAKVAPAADGTVTLTFSEPITIDEAGEFNMWIGADINRTAEPGNNVVVKLTGLTTNNGAVELADNLSATRAIKAGFSGSFVVGSSENADYATIAAAVEAVKDGVEGSVIFRLENGTYNEDIRIENVEGTSAENPLIFTSVSGNSEAVVIAGSKSYATDDDNVVLVVNTPHVAFRGLTFRPTASGYGNIIHYHNASRYGTIDNCVIAGPTVDETEDSGTNLIKTSPISLDETEDGKTESVANTENDYFTVKNSRLSGGYIAMYLSSTGYVGLPKATGYTVTDNTIDGYASKGIYAADLNAFTLKGNTITRTDLNRGSRNGMDIYRATGAFVIEGNRLSTTMASNSTSSTSVLYMRATDIVGGTDAEHPARVVNNVVTLTGSGSYSSYGIQMSNYYNNVLIAHNSILVKSSDATERGGYALGLTNPAANPNSGIQVRNNVLQTASASSPLNIWNDTDYANIEFSGNVFYGGSNYVDNQSTKHDLAAYAQLTGDNTSIWHQAEFYSDSDLRLRSAEGYDMTAVAGVDTDFTGATRQNPTTAGAYLYVPVVVETPVIAEGYPKVAKVADVSAEITTQWSVAGELYAKVVAATETAPTAEELKATRPTAYEAGVDVTTKFNYLTQLTSYKAYFLAVSSLGEESEIVVSPEFTTLETILPLSAEVVWDEEPYNVGDQIELSAYAEGGKKPYEFLWTNQMNEEIGTADSYSETAQKSQTYRLKVTSADGQTVVAKANVPVVTETLIKATFDDLPLEAESNWIYDPNSDEYTYTDAFFSGSMQFGNFPMVEWGAWSGYGYANETSNQYKELSHQMRNAVGGGAAGTAAYGVAYLFQGVDGRITLNVPEAGVTVPGMYVTNSAWVVDYILNGNSYGSAFTDGDYYEMVIEGLDADKATTGKVTVALADYRTPAETTAAEGSEAASPKILTDWQWVDLSDLGAVNKLKITLQGSASQITKVPTYVCIDEIGAGNPSGVDCIGIDDSDRVKVTLPTANTLAVTGIDGSYVLRLYSIDGIMRAAYNLEGASTVSTTALATGTYVVEVLASDGTRHTSRILKR